MRTIQLFTFLILCSTLHAQIFPAKYFEDAYFTNYNGQIIEGALQNDFSSPIQVLKHLLIAQSVEDYSKITKKEVKTIDHIERLNQVIPFLGYCQESNCTLEISFSIEYNMGEDTFIIFKCYLFQDDLAVNQGHNTVKLALIKNQNQWFLYEQTKKEDNIGKSDFARIKRFFLTLDADKLQYLITGKFDNPYSEMINTRFYITGSKGINISKMTDLVLYWGPMEGKGNLENFFSGYPLRKFRGWDISKPRANKWFKTRSIGEQLIY